MKTGVPLFFSILFILFIASCGRNTDDVDCTNALPEPNWFEIGFVNMDGEPLIGTVYLQEEFRLFNASSELMLSSVPFGDPTRLQVGYDDIVSDVDYYIELTETDNDTLRFIYSSSMGSCFINYDLQEIIYNGDSYDVGNSSQIDLVK